MPMIAREFESAEAFSDAWPGPFPHGSNLAALPQDVLLHLFTLIEVEDIISLRQVSFFFWQILCGLTDRLDE
jgi:hypothetical protein